MKKFFRVLWRGLLVLLATLLAGGLTAAGGLQLLLRGPSVAARNAFIRTLNETSRGPAIAAALLTEEELAEVTAGEGAETDDQMNGDLVQLPGESPLPNRDDPDPGDTDPPAGEDEEDDGLELVRLSGGAYKGALLIVKDPRRVFVGSHNNYGTGRPGLEVDEFIEKYGASAGMNAGGFLDYGGQGNGGTPIGLVISDGKIIWGERGGSYSICGFDDEGRLYVGRMTGAEALRQGVTSACSFGPTLILNGVPQNQKSSLGSGRNPRTAIGQRADGAILMLTIEGRQVDSLGATMDEVVEILYEYGAVNATNLDGGSSTILYLHGEKIIRSSTIASSSRGGATAILVK